MTETSSKGVLRSITVMFLFVGLVGIWMGGCGNQTSEQKVERLIKKLQHENPEVRVNAAEALGSIGEGAKDAVPALIQALQDQNKDVRWNAVEALRRIGSLDTVSALIQVLQDADSDVRSIAAVALGEMGPEAKDCRA